MNSYIIINNYIIYWLLIDDRKYQQASNKDPEQYGQANDHRNTVHTHLHPCWKKQQQPDIRIAARTEIH